MSMLIFTIILSLNVVLVLVELLVLRASELVSLVIEDTNVKYNQAKLDKVFSTAMLLTVMYVMMYLVLMINAPNILRNVGVAIFLVYVFSKFIVFWLMVNKTKRLHTLEFLHAFSTVVNCLLPIVVIGSLI